MPEKKKDGGLLSVSTSGTDVVPFAHAVDLSQTAMFTRYGVREQSCF